MGYPIVDVYCVHCGGWIHNRGYSGEREYRTGKATGFHRRLEECVSHLGDQVRELREALEAKD